MGSAQQYSVIANAINHPDALNPYQCLWNHRILRALARENVELEVVSPRPFAPPIGPYSEYASLPAVDDWGPYNLHHPRFWYLLPKRLLYAVSGTSYAHRVPRYIERTFHPPDVVHACHIYPDGYGMLPYVRKHDVPLFIVSHGTLIRNFEAQPPGVAPKIRETLDAAEGVFCVSDKLTAKASTLTEPSKVETVPIGADPERFPTDQRAHLRRELDIPADATVVLFVGQFIRRKGIPELAEALPQVDAGDTVFAFIGHDDAMLDELKAAVTESDFSSRYIYTGVTSLALRRWFAIADLLLLPSRAEGRPTVVYEAMASETAVLATSVGGIPEQVVDGETGVLIPPSDVERLREALDTVPRDRDELRRMGVAGRERLRENGWTWRNHAARVRERHLEAIGKRAAKRVSAD